MKMFKQAEAYANEWLKMPQSWHDEYDRVQAKMKPILSRIEAARKKSGCHGGRECTCGANPELIKLGNELASLTAQEVELARQRRTERERLHADYIRRCISAREAKKKWLQST
jgi:hypothetical protein